MKKLYTMMMMAMMGMMAMSFTLAKPMRKLLIPWRELGKVICISTQSGAEIPILPPILK